MKRGDVVLIDFPFSDRTGSKLRPALLVQDDAVSAARDDGIASPPYVAPVGALVIFRNPPVAYATG